jgi:hypothetical protein
MLGALLILIGTFLVTIGVTRGVGDDDAAASWAAGYALFLGLLVGIVWTVGCLIATAVRGRRRASREGPGAR